MAGFSSTRLPQCTKPTGFPCELWRRKSSTNYLQEQLFLLLPQVDSWQILLRTYPLSQRHNVSKAWSSGPRLASCLGAAQPQPSICGRFEPDMAAPDCHLEDRQEDEASLGYIALCPKKQNKAWLWLCQHLSLSCCFLPHSP